MAAYESCLFGKVAESHSPTSATGTGWERTPWHATQRAAWETLKKMSATNYTLGWMLRLALCALMLAGCGPVTYGPEPPPRDGGPRPFDISPEDDNGLI